MSQGSLGFATHDPAESLDYTIDWSEVLAVGESVSVATWSVATGLTKGAESIVSPYSTVWLSGGTAGTRYLVDCQITTSASRIFNRSFEVRVEHK